MLMRVSGNEQFNGIGLTIAETRYCTCNWPQVQKHLSRQVGVKIIWLGQVRRSQVGVMH